MHLAQLNIARLTEPIDHPATADFVAGLEPVNALAEASPGFVWRLQDDSGDATSFRPHPDPSVIVNLTVWESPEALRDFVYRSAHTPFLRRRAEWFTPMQGPQVVGWWIPAGHIPDLGEAFARLEFLAQHGSSPYAFTVTRPLGQLDIRRARLDDAESIELIGELNAELSGRYPEPGATSFRLESDEVVDGSGRFVVAALDGAAVGCGAYRVLGAEADGEVRAEIKRMYVRPAARRLKIGAAVLAELERQAAVDGATRLVLETGTRQPEAVARYRRAGYAECACWGEYAAKPLSLCMEKSLV